MPRESFKKMPTTSLIREASGDYIATRFLLSEAEILATAEAIIEWRFLREEQLQSAADTRRFLRAKLVTQDHEQFGCLFLDNRHRVIAWEVLFHGTIDGCSVHPREVVKRALHHNCAAVILAHQHPSGEPEPSRADEQLTRQLQKALALVDVRRIFPLRGGAVFPFNFLN
jgi:DNA repair protein RadC